MTRRYLPWLFLIAAVFGLIGLLSEKHPNGWFLASRMAHLGISLSYVWPQIEHMLRHLHR